MTYESVLVIQNVSNKDYGFFECHAQNPLGTSQSAIHLDGTSKPDTPLDLKVGIVAEVVAVVVIVVISEV